MGEMSREEVKEVLYGGVDLHVHTSPDIFPRKLDDIEAAIQAKEAGLRGVVLKNHFFPTAERALIGKNKTGFDLIGSITLNKTVGGINPYAVEMAIKEGAKIVWMPTIHSLSTVRRPDVVAIFQEVIKPGEDGLSLLKDKKLVSTVCDVLEIIKDSNVVLATGHIYPEEVIALVKKAVEMKLNKIILTHPFSSLVRMSMDQVKGLLNLAKNIFVEFTSYDCCPYIKNPLTIEQITEYIAEIGCESVILTSDGGQQYNPYPVDMLTDMIEKLLASLSRDDIKTMLVENPSYLLNSN